VEDVKIYICAEGLSEEMIEEINFIRNLTGLFIHKELKD